MHLALLTRDERAKAGGHALGLRSVGMMKDALVDACIEFIQCSQESAEAYDAVRKMYDDDSMKYLSMEHAWAGHEIEANYKKLRDFETSVRTMLEPLVASYVAANPISVRDAKASVEADRIMIMKAIEGSEDDVDRAVSQTMIDALNASIALKIKTDLWGMGF